MKKGDAGCDLDTNCDYLHPKMCPKSLKGGICNSIRCHLGHIKGTRDIKSQSQNKPAEELTKEIIPAKKDFRKVTVKDSKQIKMSPEASSNQSTTSSEIAGLDSIMKAMSTIQEQMLQIQKDRERGMEEM